PLTINRMLEHFRNLLVEIVKQPETRLNSFEYLTEIEKKAKIMEKQERKESSLNKLKNIKLKTVNISQESLVKLSFIKESDTMPLVIEPAMEKLDLADWAKGHLQKIENDLLKYGAILFRGFNINSITLFENVASTICSNLFDEYGDLPR